MRVEDGGDVGGRGRAGVRVGKRRDQDDARKDLIPMAVWEVGFGEFQKKSLRATLQSSKK